MKHIVTCLVLLFVADAYLSRALSGQADTNALVEMKNVIGTNRISRLEIINVPEAMRTRASLTPDMLEKQFSFKVIINNPGSLSTGRELVAAIEAEKFTSNYQEGDFRWGCVVYGENGERMVTIYLDGRSNGVVMRGASLLGVRGNGGILKHLRKIYAEMRA
jgi:hypothetical protein